MKIWKIFVIFCTRQTPKNAFGEKYFSEKCLPWNHFTTETILRRNKRSITCKRYLYNILTKATVFSWLHLLHIICKLWMGLYCWFCSFDNHLICNIYGCGGDISPLYQLFPQKCCSQYSHSLQLSSVSQYGPLYQLFDVISFIWSFCSLFTGCVWIWVLFSLGFSSLINSIFNGHFYKRLLLIKFHSTQVMD
jgi:hypothetical protein